MLPSPGAATGVLVSMFVFAAPSVAPATGSSGDGPATELSGQYFSDGGIIPFVYGSAAVAIGTFVLAEPRAEPLLFSAAEGGKRRNHVTIPDYQVGLLALGLALPVGLVERPGRWLHLKGMTQAVFTTAALTEVVKNVFGRHRPSYDPEITDEDDRKSFFSGHASITASATVYLGAYLHSHVFAAWREDGQVMAWWELPAFVALAATAALVPYTRIVDNKHNLSDVLTGSAVGASLATVFFVYQQARHKEARDASSETMGVAFVPQVTSRGASVTVSF